MAKSFVDNQCHHFFYDGDITVCRLEFTIDLNDIPGINMFNSEMRKDFIRELYNLSGVNITNLSGCWDLDLSVIGKTVVKGNDTYDKTTGERIALTKAQRSAFLAAKNIVEIAMNTVDKYVNRPMQVKYCCDLLNAHHAQNHLKELINR